jgi:hypothetical protein
VTATFRVQDGFELPSRRAYVLRGSVEDGTVRAGMAVAIPVNSGLTVWAPILAVEAVDRPGGVAAVGLLFECEGQIDAAMWDAFTLPGELLAVADHDPTA